MYKRTIQDTIIEKCFQGKAVIIYGPRQVGKTTLVKEIQKKFSKKNSLYVSGDDLETQQSYIPAVRTLSMLVSPYDLIIIDEAQRIENIGLVIKILVDMYPDKQIIATGSSSFDLANKITEPLTGRAFIYKLYPLSIEETNPQEFLSQQLIESRLLYGSYPEALVSKIQTPEQYLSQLVSQYLYKDILAYDGIKKTDVIIKILQALALQIGNEFSYNEIAQIVGVDKMTVEKYIGILEQAYIISLLRPLHTNQRREIKSNKKVYFWDLGVRNALINNFSPLNLRTDVGALRENFFFIERTKYLEYHAMTEQQYFWRWTDSGEIDFVEVKNGMYSCFECKYNEKRSSKIPNLFVKTYPNNSYSIVTRGNIGEYIR